MWFPGHVVAVALAPSAAPDSVAAPRAYGAKVFEDLATWQRETKQRAADSAIAALRATTLDAMLCEAQKRQNRVGAPAAQGSTPHGLPSPTVDDFVVCIGRCEVETSSANRFSANALILR